ncbi:MAG: flagellar basal body-associated FliL family protein [Alphaproteobacteria bacterium]
MAEPKEVDDLQDEEGEEQEDAVVPRKLSGKRIVLLFVLPLLLVTGAVAAAVKTGLADPLLATIQGGEGAKSGEPRKDNSGPEHAVYYELPQMLVNLNSSGRKTNFLKIVVSLELSEAEDVPHIERVMPRIVDNFQVYLRELRIEDLRGSAGMYRLREELLLRVNNAAHPAQVTDVLFKEMLVQ